MVRLWIKKIFDPYNHVELNSGGFTLVELMVSMGLFTISLMAVLSLFTFGSAQSLRILFSQNSQQSLMDFQENFDSFLSNATRTYYCGCNPAGAYPPAAANRRSCIFNSAQSIVPAPAAGTNDSPDVVASAGATSWTLFDFESEFSQTPLDVPFPTELIAAYCQRYDGPGGVGPNYLDRPQQGCKRVYRVRFYNANPESSGRNPAPGFLFGGRIQLMVCTGRYRLNGAVLECQAPAGQCPAGTVNARCDNGFQLVSEIPGVRSVTCGQEEILGDTTTAADNFRLDFTYINSVTSDLDLISVQAGAFERNYSFSSSFRNLVERGLYFGRPSKTSNCIPNGWQLDGTDPFHPTNTIQYCLSMANCADNPCCSGIIDFTPAGGPTCISKASCWPAGYRLDDTNWANERYTCCSNQAVLKDIGGDAYECL